MWSVFSLITDLCQQQHAISCWVVNVNDIPNYSIKKIPTLTLLDFSSRDGTVCYTVSTTWEHLEHPAKVATLQRHLWSNVCSKFHENRGILKPISQNPDMGVFFTWNFVKHPKKGYFDTVFWAFLWSVSYQLFSMNLILCNIQWC